MSEIDLSNISAWLKEASADDLIDLLERANRAFEAKKNEERTITVEVVWNDIRVASFPAGEQVKALEYLLANRDKIPNSEIKIRDRRVRNSELQQELEDRWWK